MQCLNNLEMIVTREIGLPVVPSITYVPILVFTNRYNDDSLHGFPMEFFHALNTH